jgi:hypothetical protein
MMERLKLTADQEKAFKSLERAYKKCKKSGIEFYTVLETVYALNGDELVTIHCDPILTNGNYTGCDVNLQYIHLQNPCLVDIGFSGFADDTHYAELKKE